MHKGSLEISLTISLSCKNINQNLTLSRLRYVDVIGRLRSISRLSGEGGGGKMEVLGYTAEGWKKEDEGGKVGELENIWVVGGKADEEGNTEGEGGKSRGLEKDCSAFIA